MVEFNNHKWSIRSDPNNVIIERKGVGVLVLRGEAREVFLTRLQGEREATKDTPWGEFLGVDCLCIDAWEANRASIIWSN